MYKIIIEDNEIKYSDTIVFIKLAQNGSYIPCNREEAEGFCAKIPIEYIDEEENIIHTINDNVFAFYNGALKGIEQVANFEEIIGSLIIDDMSNIFQDIEVALIAGVESII